MLHSLVVHEGSIQDRDGAKLVLWPLAKSLPGLLKIWADAGYTGQLVAWDTDKLGCVLEIVSKPKEQQGFVVLPKRWIVERTFAWFGNYRILSKEYDYSLKSSEGNILLAMSHLMLKRLAS